MTRKNDAMSPFESLKRSGFDWAKIVALIFFGGIFYNQFSESQKATEARFADFKIAAEKRDERMEKMQDAQNVLVNQLTEIKGDMKNLNTGVQDIKASLSSGSPAKGK